MVSHGGPDRVRLWQMKAEIFQQLDYILSQQNLLSNFYLYVYVSNMGKISAQSIVFSTVFFIQELNA